MRPDVVERMVEKAMNAVQVPASPEESSSDLSAKYHDAQKAMVVKLLRAYHNKVVRAVMKQRKQAHPELSSWQMASNILTALDRLRKE